ncbi:GNAT family N-acetyltransferase [Echinimonas agarilytica]|uniref:GNAT family N-acetyltransferase n=1 Tax=Echinimonas agarilytica TaxID=1215918 RepID=A0AA41W8R4_9GAMM|nr:GNAT family N-acetyltransferase [Echinimonas agarilytica]MCM2680597.1 GNAT family N-acetyltransferase [Echinimonas agarilytica]
MSSKWQRTLSIETPRLRMRPFQLEDAKDILNFASNKEVTRYTGDKGQTKTLEDARKLVTDVWHRDYDTYGYGRLAVEWKDTSQVIGFCGFKYLPDFEAIDIGYRFLPEFWGQGIASEAALACVKHGREVLGINDYIGMADVENLSSHHVLLKCGLEVTETKQLDGLYAHIYRLPSASN